nr:MAG TPA: hypothetical protein [Crassvirales sp.]
MRPAICKVVVGSLRKGEIGERRTMRTSDLALCLIRYTTSIGTHTYIELALTSKLTGA